MYLFWQIVNNLPQTIYCERTSASIFAEPVNLITNLAFFISAVFTYKLIKAKNIKGSIYHFFPWLILLIGLGSTSYHSYRGSVTLLFDSVPIYIFLGLSLFLLLKKLINNVGITFCIIGLFILLQIFLTVNFSSFFNGSIRHTVSAALLLMLAIWSYKKFGKVALQLGLVFLVYVIGIIFRTIDVQICPIFIIGTHFLWHLLVAWGAYLIVRFLAKSVTVK